MKRDGPARPGTPEADRRDAELLAMSGGNEETAAGLRQSLDALAKHGDPLLRELARDVLAGRAGLREAASSTAYADAMLAAVRSARSARYAKTEEKGANRRPPAGR